ncbi:oligosaccharide flippase family protein [Streptococcus suis]
MKKIGVNVAYNMLYQVLAIIVPLITSPYLSRVLGAEKIGIDSYTGSVVFYFLIFATLGINNYGNRTIAFAKSSGKNLGIVFSSIYIIQIIMSCLVLGAYLAYVNLFAIEYKLISYIQTFQILSSMFDITWYFYGKEDFKITVLRNSFVKLAGLILIFIFVNNESDLWKYTLISSLMGFVGNLTVWPFLLREVKLEFPKMSDIKPHIKPILVLFIPVLAISIFTNIDKLMIGRYSNVVQNGFYENANKIISIPKAFITALGTVMLPRTASLIANGEEKRSKYFIENTILFTMLLSGGLMFGIIGVADVFAVVFWGKDFIFSGYLIMGMAPSFVFSVIGNVVRTQFLIPRSRDKEYIVSLIAGSIVNVVINMLLIPKYGSLGAVLGTMVAEFVMTFIQLYVVRKELPILYNIKNGLIFFVNGFIMYLVVICIKYFLRIPSVINLVILIVIGATLYTILNFLLLANARSESLKNIYKLLVKKNITKFDKNER